MRNDRISHRKIVLFAGGRLTISAAMLGTVLTLSPFGSQYAAAQSVSAPLAVDTVGEIRLQPGAAAALPIRVVAPNGMPRNVIMLIRGIPPGVHISEGRAFGPGVWAIPPASTTSLKLTANSTVNVNTNFDLSVALVSLEGNTLAEAKSILRIGTEEPGSVQQETVGAISGNVLKAPQPAAAPATTPVRLPPVDKEALNNLIEKGDSLIKTGKIAAARLMYQRAAEGGAAEGAYALGATYDAEELTRRNVVGGIVADMQLARKWYRLAIELGSADAVQRLRQLGN